jgi:hypothetical protein
MGRAHVGGGEQAGVNPPARVVTGYQFLIEAIAKKNISANPVARIPM